MNRVRPWCLAISSLGLVIAASGCVQPDRAPRYAPAWEPFDDADPELHRSAKLLLVADCQIHNLLSRALPERNLSVEAAAATSIRPPQLDLFATDVLTYVLRRAGQDVDLVVHLGDALDLACEGELDTFLRVMATSPKPWVMAPGNHDFFYFGSYSPDDPGLWDAACHRAGAELPKDEFIRRYVAALAAQPAFAPLAAALDVDAGSGDDKAVAAALPTEFSWQRPAGSDCRLERICWKLVPEEPWRSFVLQLVDSRGPDGFGGSLLLLDSCQYGRRPVLIPNAWSSYPVALNCGFTGEMLPDQLRAARAWIEAGDDAPGGVAVAFHHPFSSLAPRTRASLGWLWRQRRVNMALTAHTHGGYFAYHDLGGEVDELELNIASTTDWPMEWRTLQGFVDPEDRRIYVRAERHTLVEMLRAEGGYFEGGWEVPFGAPDDYRNYRQGEAAGDLLFEFYLAHHLVPYWLPPPQVRANDAARSTEQSVKATLLHTYRRLVERFPTDPVAATQWPARCRADADVLARIDALLADDTAIEARIELLAELDAFERTRRSRDPASGASTDDRRARYKLSQAAWAARFEHAQGRELSVEDQLIRVDWDRSMAKRRRVEDDG